MALYFDGQTTLDSEQYDAIAYYRLSKDDGAKRESDSIANQRKLIRSFLQNNPNIHLIEEAQDEHKKLEEKEEYMKTKKYVEEVARNQLGLVYPDEIVIRPKE